MEDAMVLAEVGSRGGAVMGGISRDWRFVESR